MDINSKKSKILFLIFIGVGFIAFSTLVWANQKGIISLWADQNCYISGCSREVCSDAVVSTPCRYCPEFACYKQHGICEKQSNGKCGWTQTQELSNCLNSVPDPCGTYPKPTPSPSFSSEDNCQSSCKSKGYNDSGCKWPMETTGIQGIINMGSCVIANSKHCGSAGSCNCYCWNQSSPSPSPVPTISPTYSPSPSPIPTASPTISPSPTPSPVPTPAPQNLSVSSIDKNSAVLSWPGMNLSESNYFRIFDDVNNLWGTAINTGPGTTINYKLENLKCGQKYSFHITSINQTYESWKSNDVAFNTSACETNASTLGSVQKTVSNISSLVSTGSNLWINILIALIGTGAIGYFIFRKDIWKEK